MKITGEMVVSVTLDTTVLEEQLGELHLMLEGIPNDISGTLNSDLLAVLNDVVFSDGPTAISTGLDIIHRARLGAEYERFTSAIRAGKFHVNNL